MSMFEDNSYRWRETYFVLFDARNRPTLDAVVETARKLNERFEMANQSDEDGLIDSLTIVSADDFAALDVCYTGGDEVLEQTVALIDDMKKIDAEVVPPIPWERIRSFDGRLDVLHFERISEDDDADDEMLDPSALLLVLGALARLTKGVAVDPQTGTFLSEE